MIKTKPKPQKEVAVAAYNESARIIRFYSTDDAVTEFERYGRIDELEGNEEYRLFVDARYNFREVLNYIENYG